MELTQMIGCAGCLDAETMIEMNNLAVGYFPAEMPEVGIYPSPNVYPQIIEQQQDSEKSF